jgi:hypothetical protein
MEPICHRCGESLVPDELYCAHCGAPQLRVEESESVLSAQEGSMQHSLDRVADLMRWRSAVSAALYVAVPTALLSHLLGVGFLWGLGGGILAVTLYHRRTASPTDSHIGWRIGGLMGIIAATLWLAFEAASVIIQRYVMHHQPAIVDIIKKSLHTSIATVSQQNPEFAHQLPMIAHLWLSPAGIASFYLIMSGMFALSIILFSALGGALRGHFLRSRPPHSRAL